MFHVTFDLVDLRHILILGHLNEQVLLIISHGFYRFFVRLLSICPLVLNRGTDGVILIAHTIAYDALTWCHFVDCSSFKGRSG